MAYAITFRNVTGKTTFQAVIQSLEDSKYWDNVATGWVTSLTADCKIAMTESASKGVYTATASSLTPIAGGFYKLLVYDSADSDFLATTEETYPSNSKTALNIVNGIEKKLAIPQSSDFTGQHALLLLSHVNEFLKYTLPNYGLFSTLKRKGSIVLKEDKNTFILAPINAEAVQSVHQINVSGSSPMIQMTDADFREHQRTADPENTTGEPLYFRFRQGGINFPIMEVSPAADENITIEYEVYVRPKELSATTDIALINADLLIMAGVVRELARRGQDAKTEQAIFQDILNGDNSLNNINLEISW